MGDDKEISPKTSQSDLDSFISKTMEEFRRRFDKEGEYDRRSYMLGFEDFITRKIKEASEL